jgi:formate dehydrogenase accessory protein FdhE
MASLDEIERRNPEWAPWLAVVREALAEIGNPQWEATVPRQLSLREGAPLVGEARAPALHALRERLMRRLPHPQATEAVAALARMPYLHACRRRWVSEVPSGWSQGYCPVCGNWPVFAEICGVERARYLRCGGCGAAWRGHALSCGYCGEKDHEALGMLVPEQGAVGAAIEICKRCRGYLKVFTRLRTVSPEQVLLDDLASIELDLVAAERGYRRPQDPGHAQ